MCLRITKGNNRKLLGIPANSRQTELEELWGRPSFDVISLVMARFHGSGRQPRRNNRRLGGKLSKSS